jgi:hypothetical protein
MPGRVSTDGNDFHRGTIMKTALLGIVAIAFVLPGVGSAAPSKKWYWSETQAEALVVKKVRVPYCRVFPDSPTCPGDRVLMYLESADCVGADELGSSFKFNRFRCQVVINYGYAKGRIAVYVTGPTTLRWKII